LLRINVQRKGDTVSLLCYGRIVAGLEAETLEAMAYNQHCRALLLDLESVASVDARGLGLLVGISVWVRQNGVNFALVNVPAAIRELTELARIDGIIPTFVAIRNRGKRAASKSRVARLEKQCHKSF
jgi:anti-anti-sigma factor